VWDLAIYLVEPHIICRSSPTIGINVRSLPLLAVAVSLHYLPKCQQWHNMRQNGYYRNLKWTFNAVVLKVVDIDPQRSIGPPKGSINSHGVEWGSLNGQGVNEWLLGSTGSNEAFKSKLFLIGQGIQTVNKSNKIKRADEISATVV